MSDGRGEKTGVHLPHVHLSEEQRSGQNYGFRSVAVGRALPKQEIEIEQPDTDFPCLLRDRRIGFGTIKFQSL
jgi:hypothetical protein